MARDGADRLDISAARVRVAFRRPFVTATGAWTHRDSWIVRLTRPGATGWGEVALDPAARAPELEATDRAIKDLVSGFVAKAGLDGLVEAQPPPIRAGLDAALVGCGLATLAGALAPTVAVNATIDGDDGEDAVAPARAAVSAGFETLKIKGGAEPSLGALVARIRAIRDAVGPLVRLRLDVNGSWDLATARGALDALADFDLDYVEQPISARDGVGELADLAALRDECAVPIAVDESVADEAAARAIVAAGAADVLVVKPARVGGIRAAIRIADLAAEHGVGVVISSLLETGVGLSACLVVAGSVGSTSAHGLATADILESDLLLEPIRSEAGRIAVPDPASLRVDDDAIRRFTVETIGGPW